ncbi:hypothetical protein MHU86_3510 [Fragilaria crotonensis]|nr:hypothetical protein MHU86_3510 [Fragilaria crotonensis]
MRPKSKYPSVGERILPPPHCGSWGQAQSIAQAMVDDDKLDPVALWADLAAYCDTTINRANVVLFDVRRLLSIRLDPDVSGSSFVSDFRDCLQRLRKNKAKLAEDKDTLELCYCSVEAILTEIRERETSLNIKDQASGVSGDGASGTRHSRRTVSTSAGTQQRSAGGEPGPMNRKWIIPKFPDTWKIGIGASFFKLLLEWRIEAHKGKNQFQLNEQFNTIVERFKTTATGNGKRGKQNKSRRSKKAKAGSASSTPMALLLLRQNRVTMTVPRLR